MTEGVNKEGYVHIT